MAKTGNDIFGRQSVQLFQEEGIDTSNVFADPKNPSGVALISVDDHGENCIVVASGANAALGPGDLRKAREVIAGCSILLLQLEIPVEAVAFAVQLAAAGGARVVLNPAPACLLPDSLLASISIITPNKKEAEMLTGIAITDDDTARQAAIRLSEKGIRTVIITLGPAGALVWHDAIFTMVAAPLVQAVDTTAAGDVFNGALVVALAEGMDMISAVAFACQAAAISVTRMGAQSSAPYRKELEPVK